MTNPTPLNPDAHADVARMRDMVADAIDNPGESVHEFVSLPDLYQLLDHLAVAQPVVNSVEELDALPVGSVVRGGEYDLIGEKIGHSPYLPYWVTTGEEEEEADKRDLLPARVLYLPTEELPNGR